MNIRATGPEDVERRLDAAAGGDADAYRAVLAWAAARARAAARRSQDPDAFAARVLVRVHRARGLFRRGDDAALFVDALIALEARTHGTRPPLREAEGVSRITALGG